MEEGKIAPPNTPPPHHPQPAPGTSGDPSALSGGELLLVREVRTVLRFNVCRDYATTTKKFILLRDNALDDKSDLQELPGGDLISVSEL